jgi:ATP-dependent 26S proteasome regulatory subunit
MSPGRINRITLFKIPSEEDQQKLLGIYKNMPTKAVKVSCRTNCTP